MGVGIIAQGHEGQISSQVRGCVHINSRDSQTRCGLKGTSVSLEASDCENSHRQNVNAAAAAEHGRSVVFVHRM